MCDEMPRSKVNAMSQEKLCRAIHEQKCVCFRYRDKKRVVEPHMVATNEAGHLALSGWFVRGYSQSGGRAGWRSYLLSEIDQVSVLDDSFEGPREGYQPDGGMRFFDVICAL